MYIKMENCLFTIPIYLRSSEQYETERQKKESELIAKDGEDEFGRKVELNWPAWEYNDIIGFFEIVINPGKIICVHRHITNAKRIVRVPTRRNKFIIQHLLDLTYTDYAKNLVDYYNNPDIEVKERLSKILDELEKYVKKKKYFINIDYFRNLLASLDLEKFIQLQHSKVKS